ncbi:hypothetical protein ACJMK2_029981 [Sinanodonta woodiana]|uniref:Uncharacterized protein n=1 Tax=Sinanodonta woodiana TaxID=1069815 RepID=A0ABD3XFI8_SINWO
MNKNRRIEILFILVCYLMVSKGNTVARTADTTSSSTPYYATLNGTHESTTKDTTTTNDETNTTGTNWNVINTSETHPNETNTSDPYPNVTNTSDPYPNVTNTSDPYPNVTNTSDTYPNGTNYTGTVPKWIPTTVISIICGLLFIITITTIVCHSRKIADSYVKSDGGAYVDVIKNDIHQTQENLNKSQNKHCSKAMPPEKEENTNLDIISGRGDYDEVLLDGTPAGKSLTEKDVLKKDVAFSDIEAKEISSQKESSKQRESLVYTQPKKNNLYSHVTSNLKLKNKAESFATSENQHVQGNQENCNNYDHVDLNAKMSVNEENDYLDMNYDHIHLDRKPTMGPERDFTSQPLSVKNILLEDHYDNASNSVRDEINTVGASELYSKVSVKWKHDQEADNHVSDGALEKEDSDCKESEQDKVVGETDTNIYYNTDKLNSFSKSTDKETDVNHESKPVISQSLVGPNVSVTNDASAIKGEENLKEGSKFRIKEKNCEEAKPSEYQQSIKSQKNIRSDYEEVETAL